MSIDLRADVGNSDPLIPGAYERNTLTYRQPGSMGASGSVELPMSPRSMDAATIADREREGGGAPSQRRRTAQAQARTGAALGDATRSGSWLTRGSLRLHASRESLSAVQTVSPTEDAYEERWRQWQLRNAVTSRKDARRARIVFAAIFTALGVWFGLQLLAPSLWP